MLILAGRRLDFLDSAKPEAQKFFLGLTIRFISADLFVDDVQSEIFVYWLALDLVKLFVIHFILFLAARKLICALGNILFQELGN